MEDARLRDGSDCSLSEPLNVLEKIIRHMDGGQNEQIDVHALLGATQIASAVFARKPGDGSAREQAASCQRVLGGAANICYEYATKRYRSNLINWGMLPFTIESGAEFSALPGDWIFVPGVREIIAGGGNAGDGNAGGGNAGGGIFGGGDAGGGNASESGAMVFEAILVRCSHDDGANSVECINAPASIDKVTMKIDKLTDDERDIILSGCLMNYYADKRK
jgi:aconitate hydratase